MRDSGGSQSATDWSETRPVATGYAKSNQIQAIPMG